MKHRPTDKYKHVSRERPIEVYFNQKGMLDQVPRNCLEKLLMLQKYLTCKNYWRKAADIARIGNVSKIVYLGDIADME